MMEAILQVLANHGELISHLGLVAGIFSFIFSMYISRKMFEEKKVAEKLFAAQLATYEELLKDIEKLDLDSKSVREYQNYLINNYCIFEDALKKVDEGTRVQVEPALRQASIENRKAYLTKMIRLVNSLKSQDVL